MALIRYNHNHYRPVSFNSIVDRFFNESAFAAENTRSFSPAVDIIESDEQYEIKFSVPGVAKEDIKIDLDKGKLTVSGERKKEEKTEKRNFRSIETRYGSFSRSFHLPENINEDGINASSENGVLNIVIPKAEAKETVKHITIA